MAIKNSKSYTVFMVFTYLLLICAAITCLFPLFHVLAVSFSSTASVAAGQVLLLPKGFNLNSYEYILKRTAFWRAMGVSVKRVFIGGFINMLLAILAAYPLSKDVKRFRYRTLYIWIFFLTMIFNGGLIPTYMIIRDLKLLDKIWALVLPTAVPVFNIVLLLNFFRQLPREIEEAAFVDGAGHWTILWRLFVPMSLPAIATITLFSVVNHWNSWFDGLIYMNRPEGYPLQSYLQTIIIQGDLTKVKSAEEWEKLRQISDRTLKASQIFVAAIPILLVYPYLQKYFVKGIVLGSVKG